MDTRDYTRPLFYSSLLIVGLLVGVLGTLWMTRPDLQDEPRPQVENVRFGSGAAFPPVVIPETLATRGYVDALNLNEAFKTVSGYVRPSVVFIQVESGSPRNFFRGNRGFSQSAGSGVIVSSDGYVVTNYHVIEGASQIRVMLSDKREFAAEVVGVDPDTDLAVLRLQTASQVPALDLGDSDALEVGEWVLAVGNPFRLTSTVTAGIVSALGRQVDIIDDSFGIESFIQTDAAINPGNSGGALVNLRGELVGIATAIATESGSYEGYGFAVPVRLVERVMRDLIEFGEVRRGYLGVNIWPVDAERASVLGLDRVQGVLLNNVFSGLAADLAGLRSGDVILAVGGRPVNEPNELQSAVALLRPGEAPLVEIWRDGARLMVEVELLGRESEATGRWFAESNVSNAEPEVDESVDGESPHGGFRTIAGWDIRVMDSTPRMHDAFGVQGGAYVFMVQTGGRADAGGLPRDVLIVALDDLQVDSADDLITGLMDVEGPVAVTVVARGGKRSVYEILP